MVKQIVFGQKYSQIYDSLYQDKDYGSECDFLERIFEKYNVKINTILDLGCGTANHAAILVKRGYKVTGVDRSAEMIRLAKEKINDLGINMKFINADITSLPISRKYDAIISMFSVINYLTEDKLILKTFKSVIKNLKINGIFIFDSWHGPGVISEKPVKKVKEINTENGMIIREVYPKINIKNNTVNVKYKITINNAKGNKKIFTESHFVRYLFPDKIENLLLESGFRNISFCPFLELDKPLNEKVWHMTVIAKP